MTPIAALRDRLPKRFYAFAGTASITYAGMGLSLLSAPMLARALGADGRGVLAGSFVTIQILSWVAFLGLPRGISLQEHRRSSPSRAGINIVGMLGPLSALVAILTADAVAHGDQRIAFGVRLGALVLVLAGFSQLGSESALVKGQIWRFNLARAANVILPSIAYIVAFLGGFLTLEVAYVITLGAQVVSTLIGCALAIPGLRQATYSTKVPWSFSLRYWSSSALDSVGGRVDQLLLTALTSASIVGVYAVAVTCAVASGGLTAALNQLTYSRFASQAGSTSPPSLARRSIQGALISVTAGAAVIVALAVFGETIFGPTFDGLVPIAAILVLAQLLNDQWTLRVFYQSASEDGGSLALSSGIALAVLLTLCIALSVAGLLSGFLMALSILVFASVRLAVRPIFQARLRSRAQPAHDV